MLLTNALRVDLFPYIWRLGVFTTLELALATICLVSPVILPTSFKEHQAQVKGGLTIVAVVWQTPAILPIVSIISNIFSSEWSLLYQASGRLQPGRTDRVSTMTSGLWDQVKHALFSKSANIAFRAGVIASLIAIPLHDVAPGVVAVSTSNTSLQTSISIGYLHAVTTSGSLKVLNTDPVDRATAIVRLEQMEFSVFEYSMYPNNCVVGWPNTSYLQGSATLEYPSDGACWSHQCRWEAPTLGRGWSGTVALTAWNTTTDDGISEQEWRVYANVLTVASFLQTSGRRPSTLLLLLS